MEFIRKPLWVLFALLALGYQQTQGMEKAESEKCSISQISIEMTDHILKEAFILEKTDETNFRDIGINLSLVCKDWSGIIKENAKRWVCEYFKIEEKNKDDFWRFFKGKLIYKPNTDNDEGRVDLFFSAAPNPFKHTFDLSECDNKGKHLSFHLGAPGEDKEFAEKVQTWIIFSPDVSNKLETTAQHLKPIFPVKVPVGILWTWGNWNNLGWYDYLTTESTDNLSKITLHENWQKRRWCCAAGRGVVLDEDTGSRAFKFCL